MVELSNIERGGTYEPPKMKPLNGAQWQQPALFTAKPTDEHRFPRGYTPERLHEVRAAMPPVVVVHGLAEGADSYWAKSMQASAAHQFRPGGYAAANHENQEAQARHRMTDVVARSGVEAEHLTGLHRITVGEPGTHYGPSRGAAATYRSGESSIQMNADDKHPFAESALIHEIGHHVDYHTQPDAFLNKAVEREGGASPQLEGYAVGYEHSRHVPRPGNEPPPLGYQQFHHKAEFQQEFQRASGQTVGEVKTERAKPYENTGSTWNPYGDVHLFQRPADSFETGTQKDFGQWGYRNATRGRAMDDDLGTIKVGRGVPPQNERFQPGVNEISYGAAKEMKRKEYGSDDIYIAMAKGEDVSWATRSRVGQPKPPKHPGWPK